MGYLRLDDGSFLDFDLDFLQELLGVLDKQLVVIEDQAADHPDPDSFGLGDRYDAVIGLAFVACQQYITATWPRTAAAETASLFADTEKRDAAVRKARASALRAGPALRGGKSVAEVLNAAANYWKHRDEWSGLAPTCKAAGTLKVLRLAGADVPRFDAAGGGTFGGYLARLVGNYVLNGVFRAITAGREPRLGTVAALLEEWRNATARLPL